MLRSPAYEIAKRYLSRLKEAGLLTLSGGLYWTASPPPAPPDPGLNGSHPYE